MLIFHDPINMAIYSTMRKQCLYLLISLTTCNAIEVNVFLIINDTKNDLEMGKFVIVNFSVCSKIIGNTVVQNNNCDHDGILIHSRSLWFV